ncbi:CapA family protein [Ornithinimicrobium sp. LYQ92]|uniref:CapA family protein n=1 Tax=Serinicoccus sp. LYQ92 TaxID=3378798 RepID=UPI0038556578
MTRARALAVAAGVALALTACQPGPGDVPEDEAAAPTSGESASPPAATSEPGPESGSEPTTTEPEGALEVSLAAIGDVLPHHTLNRSASAYAGGGEGEYDYAPMLADAAPLLTGADLSLCHLETPVSADNTQLSVPDTLTFNSPHQLVDALAGAGVDGCDFASNHTMDRGMAGIATTEQVLREAGLGYAGPAAEEDRAGVAEVYDVETADGARARVAHLAYTYTYPNDGSPTTHIPGEAPWLVESSWPSIGGQGIREQAATAREEGADFVVVSMHWGQEYQAEPTADQTRLAQELLGSSDVDLILGTHAHVIQPCQQVDGKHVLYGLGNFLSNQSPQTNVNLGPGTQEGMIALVTLRRDEQGTVTTELAYQPTRVEISPEVVPSHLVRLVSPSSYPETWERTAATVDQLGGCEAEQLDPDRP